MTIENSITAYKTSTFLIDSGAEISVLKAITSLGDTIVDKSKNIEVSSLSGKPLRTLGTANCEFYKNGITFNHDVHMVENNLQLKYDGILGHDFLNKYLCTIDYETKTLTLKFQNNYLRVVSNTEYGGLKDPSSSELPYEDSDARYGGLKDPSQIVESKSIYNNSLNKDEYNEKSSSKSNIANQEAEIMNIPARSQIVARININKKGKFFCEQQNLGLGVILGNTLIEPDINGQANILLLNSSEEVVSIKKSDIVPQLNNLNKYKIINLNPQKDPIKERLSRLAKELDLSHCNDEETQSILNICRRYNDIFYLEGDFLTCTSAVEHEIPTLPGKPTVNIRPYRLPESQRQEINSQINKMLDDEIISPSSSPWNSPLLLVPKKPDAAGNKKWRVVVDFRRLNDITVGDAFPLPNITDILDQLGKAKYFSTLDLANGFHQIPMSENDKEKTAFSTLYGHYHYNRMPFGLKRAPATFQRLMNNVLVGLQGIECFVYMDDIIIYGYNLAEHNSRLQNVFDKLRDHNLKLQPEKCHFLSKQIAYLGHLITENGVSPDPAKLEAVSSYPLPKKEKDIKSFLGFAGYYRRFIPNFAKLAKPLTSLLKKGTVFKWDAFCDEAFQALKGKLINSPILQFPRFNEEFLVTSDASDYAVGAVLSQGKIGEDKPICFASRTLNQAETRYATIEKELLAIIYAVEQFRPYLYGRKFTIITDHKPLTWLMNLKDPSSRLMRWRIRLEEYDYKIIYKPGKSNLNADALSRAVPETKIQVMTRSQQKAKLDANKNTNSNHIETKNKDLLQTREIKEKYFILPIHGTTQENLLATYLPDNYKIDIGEISQYKKGKISYIVGRAPIPIRSDADRNQVSSIFTKFKELSNTKESISISLPITDNNNYQELKSMCSKEFEKSKTKPIFYVNKLIKLTDPENIEQVIKEHHFTPLGGHQGETKTIEKIKRIYSWPGMFKDIREYIKKCSSCQLNKSRANKKMPMKITTTSSRPFEKIFLDIVGPLPSSYANNKFILTFQDDLTKFSEAIPLQNAEANTIAENFTKFIICKHGLPESILTDQGSNFLSSVFSEVCKLLKIHKLQTTPYHPETNGALERSHRTLAEYLRHYVSTDPLTWDNWIPYAMFVYNNSTHASTGYTPHELLYGFQSEIPTSLKKDPEVSYNYDSYASELKARLQYCHKIARENLIKNKEKSKQYYDQTTSSKRFIIGDKVLLKNHTRKNKLSPLWEGPYNIIDISSPENSIIRIKNKNKKVHNNHLKLFLD